MVETSLTEDRYGQRGVSSSKEEVHAVVDKLDPGLFPGAFCKITEDYLTGDPHSCCVIHSDGAGTKSILGYLHYRESGDPSVFRGIAQDSIVMNIDDLACIGLTDGIVVSSTVNRNAGNFPGEALASLIEGTEEFLQKLRDLGIGIIGGGGETADVGDLTGTVAVDSCAVSILPRHQILDNAGIRPGLAIDGFSSTGQATYEDSENSGIGSNGLTSARHEMRSIHYRENYPETFDANLPRDLLYCGPYRMSDPLPDSAFMVGESLLSPTRTYLPLVKVLLDELRPSILGFVHCSGGGQTKCLRFGSGVKHVKDDLISIPPLFREIQRVSGTSDHEMHKVYNLGHRFEAYCDPSAAEEVMKISGNLGIEAKVVGHTEPTEREDGANHLLIRRGETELLYSLEE